MVAYREPEVPVGVARPVARAGPASVVWREGNRSLVESPDWVLPGCPCLSRLQYT